MNWSSTLVTISDWLLVVAPLLFVVYYTWAGKWWKNIVGKSVVTMMITISLIPASKPIALWLHISTLSDTYRWLEVSTHFPAVAGILGCCYALFRVKKFRRDLSDNSVVGSDMQRQVSRREAPLSTTIKLPKSNARAVSLLAHPSVRVAPETVVAQGCDTTGHPSPAAMRSAGLSFITQYLSGGSYKDLTASALAAYKAAGINVVLNWETDGLMNSEADGVAAAHAAQSELEALGAPADSPVLFSADFDPNGNTAGIVAYMTGVASVLGKARTGIYGGYAALQAVASICSFFWQTTAWSNGQLSGLAQLYQYGYNASVGGVGIDQDEALAANYGQIVWTPVLPPYPTPSGVAVSVSATNVKMSWDAVSGAKAYMYEVESFETGQLVLSTPTDTTALSVSFSLAPGNYRARVETHASDTNDWSAWSDWVNFTIPAAPYPTPGPISVASAKVISWPAVPNATGGYMYEVENAAGDLVVPATDTKDTSVVVSLPSGSYNFRVQTHSSSVGNWSAWSALIPFTL